MAFLGWSSKTSENEILSLKEISDIFNLCDINKAGARFNWEKLNWINSQYIKNMESIKLCEIIKKEWLKMGWEPPSQEWSLKLTILLKDSIILLRDVIKQSQPFFSIPPIQEEGQDFLKINENRESLKYILNYLREKILKNWIKMGPKILSTKLLKNI